MSSQLSKEKSDLILLQATQRYKSDLLSKSLTSEQTRFRCFPSREAVSTDQIS